MSTLQRDDVTVRLLADGTVGKLARWLRLLGYDCRYLEEGRDAVAHQARAEDRVLLTRDRELARRQGLRTVLIASDVLSEQIAQVTEAVGSPPETAPTRCTVCNVPLQEISVEEARADVPTHVIKTHETFHRCPKCGRIYWQGTHWEGIERETGP
ncbi:MAG: Mut7-C RNAse domain-containing protein [Anaerolineae bacterium]